ncbi:hypothetical protein N7528_007292 [Penicillium herquei]|nr:hypothetical protein N7528_007292 [Penicillium herquei]
MIPELCERDALHLSVLGPSRSRMPTGRGTRGRPANWTRAWLAKVWQVWCDDRNQIGEMLGYEEEQVKRLGGDSEQVRVRVRELAELREAAWTRADGLDDQLTLHLESQYLRLLERGIGDYPMSQLVWEDFLENWEFQPLPSNQPVGNPEGFQYADRA